MIRTESAFARCVCGVRAMWASMPDVANAPFLKAFRFTHKEPSYHGELFVLSVSLWLIVLPSPAD